MEAMRFLKDADRVVSNLNIEKHLRAQSYQSGAFFRQSICSHTSKTQREKKEKKNARKVMATTPHHSSRTKLMYSNRLKQILCGDSCKHNVNHGELNQGTWTQKANVSWLVMATYLH